MASSSRSQSPPAKKPRLESDENHTGTLDEPQNIEEDVPDDLEENNCSICLQPMLDRTLVPGCSHEFCFDCLMIWSEQSRRCPLCVQNMGDFVIHNIRSRYDYQKYYLPPIRPKSPQMLPMARAREPVRRRRIPREIRERSRREREQREEADRLEHAIEKRKWIYRHNLYAKHVASNAFTRYRPYPTPSQFSANQDLISRTISFLRRELRVWPDLDVEFLTTFIISLMKSIDIRSESAVKLLAEFLDMDEPYFEGERHVNAEHFAHEVYSYVRSPYKDLFVYDTVVQYDTPSTTSPQSSRVNSSYRRWEHDSSRSYSPPSRPPSPPRRRGRRRSISRSRSRSQSWSPSGRNYPSTRERERQLNRNYSPRIERRQRSRSHRRSHSPAHVVSSSSKRHSHHSRDDTGSSISVPPEMADHHPEHISDIRDDRESMQGNTAGDSIQSSPKGKGKARAVPAIPLPKSDSKGSPSTPTTTTTLGQRKPLPPPRMRNLQESVQAHLAPDMTKSHSARNVSNSKLPKSAPSSSMSMSSPNSSDIVANASTPKVSLLSRLSDIPALAIEDSKDKEASTPSSHGNAVSASVPINSTGDITNIINISNPVVSGSRSSLGPKRSSSSSASLNTSQSLQARLAKELRNARTATSGSSSEPSYPKSDSDPTNGKNTTRLPITLTNSSSFEPHGEARHDDGQNTQEQEHLSHVVSSFSSTSNQIIQSNSNNLISRSSTDSDVSAVFHHTSSGSTISTPPTLRERLLYRLEEERRKANDFHTTESNLSQLGINLDDGDDSVSGLSTGLSGNINPDTDNIIPNPMDAVAIEAKLKLRAQLKARLASEKRNSNS
ncbi:hypothetical protein VKT23_019272 [Stygiomarasmius scandens]|uniref:RING-type E3 ubiquitin transferase n=1 Tax=Marasmiellus scandens TaxID=2682957 RepID=A0ABR1ILU1_9AGAR